jgi:hypothetical protein
MEEKIACDECEEGENYKAVMTCCSSSFSFFSFFASAEIKSL